MSMESMSGMTMSMTTSPSMTMTGMSMSTTTAAMDMSSGSTMMGMDQMTMTFFTATTTPLFSMAWTPNGAGQYAGTCIFLIALSAIFRALLAVRVNLLSFISYVKHRGESDAIYGYGSETKNDVRPWRASEAVWIASMDVVLGGIAYLLMIAVMTMNVGYFLSVLGGIFLGSLIFGHYMARSASH